MKYLVDANVLSEPTKPSPDPRVVDWLRANEPDVCQAASGSTTNTPRDDMRKREHCTLLARSARAALAAVLFFSQLGLDGFGQSEDLVVHVIVGH